MAVGVRDRALKGVWVRASEAPLTHPWGPHNTPATWRSEALPLTDGAGGHAADDHAFEEGRRRVTHDGKPPGMAPAGPGPGGRHRRTDEYGWMGWSVKKWPESWIDAAPPFDRCIRCGQCNRTPSPPTTADPEGPEHLMDPLSAFETLVVTDRRPGFPMAFFVEARLEGPLDQARLEAAVAGAADRHPRTRMRIARRGGGWVWLPPDRTPVVEWWPLDRPRDAADPWRPCRLTDESGLRIVALERERHVAGPPCWSVVLMVDHAVCDGLAGIEWMGDVWSLYHGGRPARFRERIRTPADDPAAAADPVAAAPLPSQPAARRLARESGTFALLRPTVLAPHPTHGRTVAATDLAPPYHAVAFSPDDTRRLWAIAAAAGVTVNDLLVGAAMQSVLAWNAAAGRQPRHVRINMPVSLRPVGARLPAGNHIGYAFLDRSAGDCAKPVELVRSLAAASRWIQETGAAAQFLHAVEKLRQVPGLLWVLTRLPACLSSAVVSNVGNVGPRMRADVPKIDGCDAPRDLRLTAIVGAPPLRPRTRAAVGVMTYAGSLRLAVMADERTIGAGASARLAERLREAVVAIAATVAARPMSDERS